MKTYPLVSVIIPIYNVEKYLERCLKSVLEQTYKNIEVICVNDGSPDNSQLIVNKYSHDSRIISIIQENKGLSGARNTGLRNISGEYVMFVDSDDWLYLNCIQVAIDNALSSDLDVVMWPYTKVFKNRKEKQFVYKKTTYWLTEKNVKDGFYKDLIGPSDKLLATPHIVDSRVTAPSKLYKSNIIRNIRFIDTNLVGTEDLLFNSEVFLNVKSCGFINKELYFYNKVNESSLTSSYKPNLINQWDLLHSKLEKISSFDSTIKVNLSNRYAVSIIGLGLNVMSAPKSFLWRRNEIRQIIYNEKYSRSLNGLSVTNMPVHWKIFFISAKNKLVTPLTLLLLFIHKVILK